MEVMEFTVPTKGIDFEWHGYGLKLHIPKQSLPLSMGEISVNITASFAGQYQISDLLSPIFWITAPCKFINPVMLEIQHCALRENHSETVLSHLSFVSAKCSQKKLPYRFTQLDGGVFSPHSSYGCIELSHFSGFGVTGKRSTSRSYCAHLYHKMNHMHEWRFYFIITQDLDAKNTVHCTHAQSLK